jgi:acetylornithine/succinyldiaminopimelate/putrescine aminotransferase
VSEAESSVRKIIDESLDARFHDAATYLVAAHEDALPVARADLLYLWDDYRTEYLDFAALLNPVGHFHPQVRTALTEHGRYYGLTAPQGHHLLRWPVQYAKNLSERFSANPDTPRQVLFCEGEREAVLVAAKLTRRWSMNKKMPLAVVRSGWHDWLPIDTFDYPFTGFDPEGVLWDRVSGLLLSMVDQTGMPLANAREWILAAREAGVPVIVDESVTGFGRLGHLWGQDRTGLLADISVLGGAVGGGYPLGAVIAAPEWFLTRDVSPLAGNPMACSAGAHTLDVIELGVLEYMEDSSAILVKGLTELCAQFPQYLRSHHGEGLLHGLVFDTPTNAERFAIDVRAHGLYVAPPVGFTVVLAPVLITSTNEMTRGVDLMAATLMGWDDSDKA